MVAAKLWLQPNSLALRQGPSSHVSHLKTGETTGGFKARKKNRNQPWVKFRSTCLENPDKWRFQGYLFISSWISRRKRMGKYDSFCQSALGPWIASHPVGLFVDVQPPEMWYTLQ